MKQEIWWGERVYPSQKTLNLHRKPVTLVMGSSQILLSTDADIWTTKSVLRCKQTFLSRIKEEYSHFYKWRDEFTFCFSNPWYRELRSRVPDAGGVSYSHIYSGTECEARSITHASNYLQTDGQLKLAAVFSARDKNKEQEVKEYAERRSTEIRI